MTPTQPSQAETAVQRIMAMVDDHGGFRWSAGWDGRANSDKTADEYDDQATAVREELETALRAELARPQGPCQHFFTYFGDQPKRRCVNCDVVESSPQEVAAVGDAGNEARMRASGMYGLLSEILGSGALLQVFGEDHDLIDRVKMACADQESAMNAVSRVPVALPAEPVQFKHAGVTESTTDISLWLVCENCGADYGAHYGRECP